MEFTDVKTNIVNNFRLLDPMLPGFNYSNVITEMLNDIEIAMADDKNLDVVIDQQYKNDINYLLEGLVEYVSCNKLSDDEYKMLNCLSLLFSNFFSIYPKVIDKSYLYNVFNLFIDSYKSLSDLLALNMYLAGRLRSMTTVGCSNNELSAKYLYEYKKFLSDKCHDSNYSINESQC